MKSITQSLLFPVLLAAAGLAWADPPADVVQLQERWAEIRYQMPEDQRAEAFEALVESAEAVAGRHPESAEAQIWRGIILSTYAGEEGGLGALKLVKRARNSLEAALEIDDRALQGSAYTSLGALYYQVPDWPVSFGSDKKARKYLQQGLKLNPDGLDSNFFYADYLIEEGEYGEAETVLLRALRAAPRPGRETADQGRRVEIQEKLQLVRRKLDPNVAEVSRF